MTTETIMSIEQKAKAYDEALKRAEAAIDIAADKDLVKGVATTIFPELKEGEDEKIRNGLIRHLKELQDWKVDTMVPIKVSSHYDEWITWLEKQKEQKPVEWSEDDSIKIGTLSSIIFDYAFHKDALDENLDLTGVYAELDSWLKSLPERFNLQPQPKQEQKPEAKLTGWVARDKDERLWVYEICPKKYSKWQQWIGNEGSNMHLDQESFPDLKWEDEPVEVEVEITIRKR